MTHPIAQIEQLFREKRAIYYSSGRATSVKGEYYCTIWGNPSSDILSCGHADTLEDAMRAALSHVPGIETKPVQIETRLPGLTTRMRLPGL